MEGWKKFAEVLELTKELEGTYLKLREFFQREGWTQKDIERPPYYTAELMDLHSRIKPLVWNIERTIRDHGFNVDETEVNNYIMNKISHIDDITPLRKPNGNNKRDN
jgi:anti-sigma regulatory factor (Ser/Thr protein kinase)